MRIVSLSPAGTQMLVAIGGDNLLVGRSHACAGLQERAIDQLPALTRQTDEPDWDAIRSTNPDLVVTDPALTTPDDLQAIPIGTSRTLDGVFDDIARLADAIDRSNHARDIVVGLRARLFRAAEFVTPYVDPAPGAFLQSLDPLITAGDWIPQMIERAGGAHPLNLTVPVEGAGSAVGPVGETQRVAGQAIQVPPEVLQAIHPSWIVVSIPGMDVPTMRTAIENAPLPTCRVALVEGDRAFHVPGPGLVTGFEWLVGWLGKRDELLPPDVVWEAVR